VTHTLDAANARAHHNCSIRRASGFVQTRFSSAKVTLSCYVMAESFTIH
jgi:hypothetical protein